MQIGNNSVVSLQYVLKNSEGITIDESSKERPLDYLHGHQNIIPGLESALENKIEGDSFDVAIDPENAYGPINPSLIQEVSRNQFQGVESLEVGMRFQANTDKGPIPVEIKKINGDKVTMDGNHPLAGETLYFSIQVETIREATDEEIKQGHLTSSGGCCGGSSENSCGCN